MLKSKFRIGIIALATSCLLAACGGGSNGHSGGVADTGGGTTGSPGTSSSPNPPPVAATAREKIQAVEDSGAIPKLERGTTVAGVDVDNNGIRDDIDQFIARTYATDAQRKAASQLAKYLQQAILADAKDRPALKQISVQISRAVNCLDMRFDGLNGAKRPARVVQELESVTANTKARLTAYLAYNKGLDGTSGSLPEGDTCE